MGVHILAQAWDAVQEWTSMTTGTTAAGSAGIVGRARAQGRTLLSEVEAKAMLAEHGPGRDRHAAGHLNR